MLGWCACPRQTRPHVVRHTLPPAIGPCRVKTSSYTLELVTPDGTRNGAATILPIEYNLPLTYSSTLNVSPNLFFTPTGRPAPCPILSSAPPPRQLLLRLRLPLRPRPRPHPPRAAPRSRLWTRPCTPTARWCTTCSSPPTPGVAAVAAAVRAAAGPTSAWDAVRGQCRCRLILAYGVTQRLLLLIQEQLGRVFAPQCFDTNALRHSRH